MGFDRSSSASTPGTPEPSEDKPSDVKKVDG
jgi:hypothetical protein